ncbi:MAG: FAD-dependent oxidoreductase [Clostridiales bacterium]|nr:FAD-dependent oxidoreductase [Clostridiales bacterium]
MKYDVIVIGGGPAGMSAGLESARNGSKTLIIERNPYLGGILKQCIHNGFGLHYFKEEFTGPEYAKKFISMVAKEPKLDVMTNTFVTGIDGTNVEIMNENGAGKLTCKALVLAMGCRERTAGNILLTGSRPAGVYTAGEAQRLVNILGKMPGKEVVILGSGDIGLIMARRLTMQGAKVKAVLEINSTTSGLRRNVVQCLDDFGIPLLLNTSIFEVVGKDRVEGVWYGKVDEKYNKLVKTKKFMKCDTIILSVGLVPETDLVDMPLSRVTKSVSVDNYLMTEKDGVFACGNFLHVHDLVDNVSLESAMAGKFASMYAKGKLIKSTAFNLVSGAGISYVIPSKVYNVEDKIQIRFRIKQKVTKTNFVIKNAKGELLAKKYVLASLPGEMQTMEIDGKLIKSDITVSVEGL